MNLRSLGYRTDLIFPAFDGEIIDRGDYLVVLSPLNPSFYWGNFLLFSAPPQPGDFDKWRTLFASEIGGRPGIMHQTFGWDSSEGDIGFVEPFAQAGFSVNRAVVLTSSAPHPPARVSAAVNIRTLTSASDWVQAFELQVLCREPEHEEAEYRVYRRDAIVRYRKMEAARRGHWYGAFVGERLVADLGVFHDGRGLGRYQSVETHPDFRRQGIAGALVYEAGHRAMAEHGLHTLVMIAEEGGSPARLYQAVGFTITERAAGLLWWEGKPTATAGSS